MRRNLAVASAIVIVLLLAGAIYIEEPSLVGRSSSSGPTASVSISARISTSTRGASASSISGADWTTYHENNNRTGYLPVANFTSVTSAWNSTTLDGAIYAEPLVYGSDVYVATENNSVYALNAQTGSVLWRTHLGAPVEASMLQCGDIGPVTGITGTPVIDPSTGTLYAVSFNGATVTHILSAINIATGAILWQRGADPPGFDVTAQQERSALTLANGMVYIPYGGLAGDCGQYYGWVVGIPANGTGNMVVYQVPTDNRASIWAPSGAAVDPAGNVYVTTGNGASSSTFDYGESVIKLSPTLSQEGYFAASNWSTLNVNDADLGSVGPAFVGPNLIFQIGKEGVGYLLNASQLGGIGGQLYSSNVCYETFGGTAYSSPFIFVPCIEGLFVLRVNGTSFSTVLSVGGLNAGPPIVTGSVVWTVDTNTATLYGLSTTTGWEAYHFSLGSVVHFTTPSAGDGHVFVAANDGVMAFMLG